MKVKRRGLLLLLGFVMSVSLVVLSTADAHAGVDPEGGECYPPTAECVTTTTEAVVATTAAQAPSSDELARTGSSSTMPLTAMAAVLLVAGGLFVLVTRRRGPAPA